MHSLSKFISSLSSAQANSHASHILSTLPSPCLLVGRVLINKTPSNTNLLPKTTRKYPKLQNFDRRVHKI
nr:hypothetical protein CFP56_43425 [Quercus suber]